MALAEEKVYESRIGGEKRCTEYKWVLNDWILLYDIHYSKGIKSQKFLLDGTDGVSCQMTLTPYDRTGKTARVKFDLSHNPKLLIMILSISSIEHTGLRRNLITQTYNGSVCSPMDLQLSNVFPQTYDRLAGSTLILLAEFVIVKSIINSPFPNVTPKDDYDDNFRNNLKSIYNDKKFYDVTFVIGNEKLFAHKVILAAKSEVFERMFTTEMREKAESEIVINDVKIDVFAEFLNYFYVEKIDNLGTLVDEMIIVADKYQVQELKTMCENYMSSCLGTGNVVKYLLIAYKLCCDTMKKKALDLIKRNTHVLANEADYRLLVDHPELIREVFDN